MFKFIIVSLGAGGLGAGIGFLRLSIKGDRMFWKAVLGYLVWQASAMAVPFFVGYDLNGNYGFSLGPTDTSHTVTTQVSTGQLPLGLLSVTPFGSTISGTDQFGRSYTGMLAVNGLITPGALHASISAFGSTNNSFNDPFVQFGAGGGAGLTEQWDDTITISGLPAGTPVDLNVVDFLHSTVMKDVTSTDGAASVRSILQVSPAGDLGTSLATFDFRNDTTGAPQPNITQSQIVHTQSGAMLTLFGEMTISAAADVGYNSPAGELSVSASADASNTNNAFLTVLTPGASFTSASGASYSQTAAPEPSALGLCAAGLTLALLLRRRQVTAQK